LEARNDEIIAKLDALYKQNAEIMKANIDDSMIQDWIISMLFAFGASRDDDLAERMGKDHDFIVGVLSMMKDAKKVIQDTKYGWWSLP
jgi:hypothetical protein